MAEGFVKSGNGLLRLSPKEKARNAGGRYGPEGVVKQPFINVTHKLLKLDQRPTRSNVRFGSKADMCSAQAHVCFVPIADIGMKVCNA